MLNKNRFDLIIFDLDGTLVDTLDDLTYSVNKVLEDFGIAKASKEQVQSAIGRGAVNLFSKLTNNTIDIKKAKLQFTRHYSKNLVKKSKLYPGILSILKELRKRNIILYVVSNKAHIFTRKLLKDIKIGKYFSGIIGINSEEKERLKPSPYYIKKILSKEKIKPENALIIGDSKTDILAAKNSKVYSCAALYGYRPTEELRKHKPDFYIKKPLDILKIIN